MTQAKHTPGPWSDPTGTSVYAGKKLVAAVYGDDPECKSDDRMTANARLMAAAPDLLEALIHCATDEGPEQEWLDRARAAIAKATGSAA